MAENINIKVLIDAAEAAKTVQETRKALKDLRSAALQVEEGSDAFRSVTTAAGELQDKMGDLGATTKYLGDDLKNLKGLTSIATGIAGGFAAAQGAAALFGGENEMVEQSLIKVQAAMGILQGIQAVGEVLQKESAATLFLQNTYRSLKVALLGEETVATVANTVATEAEAIATGEAAIAQEALNTTMKMNPILAVIGLITAAAAALYAFSKDTDEAEESTSALNKSIEGMKTSFELESRSFEAAIEQLKKYTTGSKEREIAIKNINEQYGTNLQNLKDEKKFLEQVNIEVARYATEAKARLMIKINESKAEDALAKAETKRSELRRANKTVENLRKESAEMEKLYQKLNKMSAEQISKQTFDPTGNGIDMANAFIDIKANIPLAIKQYENYVDALLKVNSKYVGKVELGKKEEVKTETNKNAKIIKEKKEFVADYTKLDEEILQNNIEIADQIEKNWSITYQDQTENLKSNLKQQTDALKKEYADSLAEVESQFNLWKESDAVKAKIKSGGWDTATMRVEFERENAGFVQRQVTLRQQLNTRIQLVEVENNKELLNLRKEHEQRVKDAMMETNRELLASPEYKRYLEYITSENQQAQNKIAETNSASITKYNNDLLTRVKLYQKHQKTIEKIAKDENLQLSKDADGQLQISSDFINAIGEDLNNTTVASYYDAYEQSKQFRKELAQLAQAYVNAGTTIEEQMKKIDIAGPVTESFERSQAIMNKNDAEIKTMTQKQAQYINELTSTFPKLTDEATTFIEKMSAGTGEADKKMLQYIATLKRLNLIDPKELDALGNFSRAIDGVNDKLDITTEMQNKVGRTPIGGGLMENVQTIEEVFKKVFDLRREIKVGEAGENKLLIGVYRDKLQVLQSGEAELGKALEDAIAQRKKKLEAEVANAEISAKSIESAYSTNMTVDVSKGGLINASQQKVAEELKLVEDAKIKVADLKAELAGVEGFKGFKIFPTDKEMKAGMMSLEQAINKYPQLSKIITDKTKVRYEELVKISNEFYEKEKFELFMQLNNGKITQEEYDKKSQEMKINHEENMLSIDVAYGKKGQEAIAENEKKKTDIIKSEDQKKIDEKWKLVDKLVELETLASQFIMQLYQNETDLKIKNIGIEYDARVQSISDEQTAWEESLKERSVVQIQEDEKRKSFDKKRKEQEEARDNEIKIVKMEQFRRQKLADIAQATINGALAITKNWATAGPLAPIINALSIASVATQIGIISAQQPAFAEGGLVTGPGGPKDDKITARLSNGESVINAKSTKQFAPILSAINQAGGGKPIPSMSGGNMANGGGGMTTTYIGEKAMSVDNTEVVAAIERLNQRPIETYVKESTITSAQNQTKKENRRSSY
jgi:hypothetical protein